MTHRSPVATVLAIVCLAAAAAAQGPLVPAEAWSFHEPGPFPQGSADWDDGNVQVSNPFGGAAITVHHFGVIWFPADDAGNLLEAKAPFPLVVFAHGRFQSGPFIGQNHKQATYLLKHLASWGCIVASVNLDVVGQYANPAAIPQRGELINKTVSFLRETPAYAKSIDFGRILLIGHSRGGEGVFAAVQQSPWFADSIRGVSAIAPTNFMNYSVPANAFVIYGSQDGDVNNGMPIQLYDRTLNQFVKGFRFIEGANHFFFTDSITYGGEGTPILTRPQHHEIAQTYFATWASAMHFGDRPSRMRIAGDIEIEWSAPFAIHRIFSDPERVTVDDFEQTPANPFENTLGGTNALSTLIDPVEKSLDTSTASSFFHVTKGLVAQWQSASVLRADLGSELDVARFPYASVNVLQKYNAPLNPAGQEQIFELTIRDSAGESASLFSTDLGPWPYPATQTPGSSPKKSVLKTFRFPLVAFAAQNPLLDLTKIRDVVIQFGATPTGDVAIDDLCFTE